MLRFNERHDRQYLMVWSFLHFSSLVSLPSVNMSSRNRIHLYFFFFGEHSVSVSVRRSVLCIEAYVRLGVVCFEACVLA